MPDTTVSIGKKICRIREIRGMKQETLAIELGISQQAVSKMEQAEKLDDETIEKVARALGLAASVIRNFSEQAILENPGDGSDKSGLFYLQLNGMEKIIELYERLLASEREKVELLKAQLDNAVQKRAGKGRYSLLEGHDNETVEVLTDL